MAYEIERTEEFTAWWGELTEAEQESVRTIVILLQEKGPSLGRPCADTLRSSKYPNLKELIIQHAGRPYRVFFAFDPRRMAILLLGAIKTGGKKAQTAWYMEKIAEAEKIYEEYLQELKEEGLISMAGHKPFSELVAKMSPEARKRSEEKAREILAEMELAELRQALAIRQADLAQKLKTTQAAVSRLERRGNMTIGSLNHYIEALGGRLELNAVLPDRTVKIVHALKEDLHGAGTFTIHPKQKSPPGIAIRRKRKPEKEGKRRDLQDTR